MADEPPAYGSSREEGGSSREEHGRSREESSASREEHGRSREEDGSSREEAADLLFDTMHSLVLGHNALDLRVARVCAWIKTRDPAEQGYSSHTALFRQHVTWCDSRLRALIRLVECDLHEVKRAVCLGLVSISKAADAVGKLEASEQQWWLEGVQRGERGLLPPPRRWEGSGPRVVKTVHLEGKVLRVIHDARQLARLLLGLPLAASDADRFVMDCWHRGVNGPALLERARRSPPAPPKRSPPGWCDVQDPATRILGPWREPRDLADALRLLEQAQVARDSRVLLIGQAYDQMAKRSLYWHLGFGSLRAMAKQGLDIDVRTLERYREFAWELEHLPQLTAAIDQGLDLARARLVADVACEDTVLGWLEVARNTGVAELERAVKMALRCQSKAVGRRVLGEYQRAIQAADEVVRQALEGQGTETGGVGLEGLRVFVSLNAAWAPPPVPKSDRVHADLPEAAAWFLENVRLERQRGIGKVKERADYTCRNPECGCRNLRVQAHHVVWVSLGGGDEEENLICVCKPCRLRLIHTGIISVTRVGDALVWRYPGRVVVAV